MAVQFPNFLGVPVQKPDYSGLGDIVGNYYAGRQMPKDDLIKAIQAEFARPTAEEALKSARLSNTKSGLDIQKLRAEIAEQAEMERQLKQALSGGSQPMQQSQAQGVAQPQAMQPSEVMAKALSPEYANKMTLINDPLKMADGLHPELAKALTSAIQNQQQVMPQEAAPHQVTPSPDKMGQALSPQNNIQVISEGAPALSKVDELWEKSPNLRPFLEKRGFKGSEQIKFDNKTGKTSVITRYPSGRVTVKSNELPSTDDEAIPLTKAMITQHQNVIAGVDSVIPVLEKILELGGGEKEDEKGMPAGKNKGVIQPYPRSSGYMPGLGWVPGWMSDAAEYESLVTSAAEPLVRALGYPRTNEGIEKAVQQVITTHGERNYRYINRIKKLIEELKKKKEYSEKEVKRSNKIMPIGRMGNDPQYSSYEYEEVQ